MGSDVRCRAEVDGHAVEGTAQLETDWLLVRGDGVRVKVLFTDVSAIEADDDDLVVDHAGGRLVLRLGATTAQRWAAKVLHPPSRLDKLGVKPGHKIALVGVDDAAFVAELRAVADDVSTRRRKGCDIVFFGVDAVTDLRRLTDLEGDIVRNGAIWVLHPKGRKDLRDIEVMEAAKAAGLVDVKVARFSDERSALKLVIPTSRR